MKMGMGRMVWIGKPHIDSLGKKDVTGEATC